MTRSKSTTTAGDVLSFRQDIEQMLRGRIRNAIEALLDEELDAVLGCARHERSDERRGYRNGAHTRRITTQAGTRELRVPRARIDGDDGTTEEFRSELLPRYARRTQAIDDLILGSYLAGHNSRRIRTALEPLLGGEHLSKSAVSRIVARLGEVYDGWDRRDLTGEHYPLLFLDGFHLKVRMARRVVSVPVLAALGVAEDGTKVLIALRLAVSESGASWGGLVKDLARRGLPAPVLITVDGHAGLRSGIAGWEGVKVQRCTEHKRRNLKDHCPRHAWAEAKRDYDRIVFAADGIAARKAYDAFMAKWTALCPAVARSLEDGGEELLTYYELPKPLWRSIRTTNPLETLNREFRRRTKTQASFGTEQAAVTLLYGLVAFGQIRLRKINGYQSMKLLAGVASTKAA
jgi:transposase-like protein